MTELLTAAQMRAIEQAAIASGDVTGLELMERAGRGVVQAVFEEWPELSAAPFRAVVLCGPGNNGGDGFVVARLLKDWGWAVEVFLYGDPDRLPPDAKANYDRWCAMGTVRQLGFPEPRSDVYTILEHAIYGEQQTHVVVDALFGTGLTRPATGLAAIFDLREYEDDGYPPTTHWVAVDVPSGLCADSGRALCVPEAMGPWNAVPCDLTVTFHRRKLGHVLGDGRRYCEKVVIRDIGLDPRPQGSQVLNLVEATPDVKAMLEAARLASAWKHILGKRSFGHKYTHGHALILSGGPGHTGAARLAARGALRVGAGLVTLGVPGAAQSEVAAQVTAVMLKRAGEPEELAAVLKDKRINALCLGPGLGLGRARDMVEVACGGVKPRPTVLDADALMAFADDPEALFGMLHQGCVLTPHGGEFARLFPDIAEKLEAPATRGPAYSKVDATREAAARAGCTVLFKGPDTVIADPNGRTAVNAATYDRAAPWLATAGAGDVLAGFITGLLARGFAPMQAAETAAWLHVECARSFGPGLIAEDLPEELPKVMRALEE